MIQAEVCQQSIVYLVTFCARTENTPSIDSVSRNTAEHLGRITPVLHSKLRTQFSLITPLLPLGFTGRRLGDEP
jgi:hypothetical protein